MTAEMLEAFNREQFPQIDHMELKVEHVDDKTIRVRMSVKDMHLRPGGTVSGPTMMQLADAAMYLLLLAQIGPVALAVTTSLNINFLRKPAPGGLYAEGRLLKHGKTLAIGEFSLYSDGLEDPVAHVTTTYAIPPQR
ncbi:PaaI family thioesterase [Sneathiella sp.]|uniref:PaaI family thioesterase n=1 Tax=Sneathiella sp. TaxID=1964365 RepID=UPI003569BC8C